MAGKGQINFLDYYDKLGKNLLRIREENNLTQKDIAKKLGITFQQYQKYEKGTNRIPTDLLVIFCKETSTDIREITGCTTGDYENIYKQPVVHYTNSNNTVNNVYNHNYNGFFSNLLNMDLGLLKNKIVTSAVIISVITYFGFQILKMFPEINSQYNHIFLSIQFLVFLIAITIIMFSVFGYSFLTYIIAFISYNGLLNTISRAIGGIYIPLIISSRFMYYLLAVILTFLTFYILKKCKVNLNVPANKKEA